MRGYIKQYADRAFDPAVISFLQDAFEDAWRRVACRPAKRRIAPGNMLPLAAPSSPNTSSIKPRQESVILVGWLTARSYISRSKN